MTNPNQPTQVTMSKVLYEVFDDKINHIHGISYRELATRQPSEAYMLLTSFIEQYASAAETFKSDDGITVNREMDGEAAVTGIARHAVRESVRDTDIETFDVVVSLFQSPRFRDFIRCRETKPREILTFRVEPPNLAG